MSEDRIYWHIPQRVVMMKAARDASIDVARADSTFVNNLLATGKPPVHLIVDTSNVGMMPADMEMTEEILALFASVHLGHTVVIGFRQQDMSVVQSAADAISHVTGKPIEFANSIAQALEIFKQNDPTLDA